VGGISDKPGQHTCRACGYTFSKSAHGDCYSARCAQYLAEGNPSKVEQERLDNPFVDRRRFGPVGVYTRCAACGVWFESRGLCRCPDCTRWNRAYECRSKAPSVTIIPVPTYPTGGPSRLTFAPSHINELEGKKSSTLPLLTGAVCRVCETPIPQARRGKPKQFCSAACKQWAYRSRSAAD
jgi:predicted ATP-dependent serine protease